MNYGGQDQRYNGGQGLTDGYGEYEGGKSYYGQQVSSQGQQQLYVAASPFGLDNGYTHIVSTPAPHCSRLPHPYI